MIKIIIFKQKEISLGFKIEGHALSREEMESTTGDAYDMICNSVSVLSQSVVIGMEEVLKLPVKYEVKDGFLSLNLHNLKNEDIKKVHILLLKLEKIWMPSHIFEWTDKWFWRYYENCCNEYKKMVIYNISIKVKSDYKRFGSVLFG